MLQSPCRLVLWDEEHDTVQRISGCMGNRIDCIDMPDEHEQPEDEAIAELQ
jgi:hypothetical protein